MNFFMFSAIMLNAGFLSKDYTLSISFCFPGFIFPPIILLFLLLKACKIKIDYPWLIIILLMFACITYAGSFSALITIFLKEDMEVLTKVYGPVIKILLLLLFIPVELMSFLSLIIMCICHYDYLNNYFTFT